MIVNGVIFSDAALSIYVLLPALGQTRFFASLRLLLLEGNKGSSPVSQQGRYFIGKKKGQFTGILIEVCKLLSTFSREDWRFGMRQSNVQERYDCQSPIKWVFRWQKHKNEFARLTMERNKSTNFMLVIILVKPVKFYFLTGLLVFRFASDYQIVPSDKSRKSDRSFVFVAYESFGCKRKMALCVACPFCILSAAFKAFP